MLAFNQADIAVLAEPGITHYVLGFLFTRSSPLAGFRSDIAQSPRVLLILKARPKWQAGRLNGVGGHIEPGETALAAMRREFAEEAGLVVNDWQLDTVLTGIGWQVLCYSAWVEPEVFESAVSLTDERLVPVNADEMFALPVMPNLRVLVPLALDRTGIAKPVVLTDNSPPAN